MGLGSNLRKEITEWGILGMVVVILSVVLLKFKDISGSNSNLNDTIDTFVSAFSQPKSWIVIVIIGLIGMALIGYFQRKTK